LIADDRVEVWPNTGQTLINVPASQSLNSGDDQMASDRGG
jgi:hypothetical protein